MAEDSPIRPLVNPESGVVSYIHYDALINLARRARGPSSWRQPLVSRCRPEPRSCSVTAKPLGLDEDAATWQVVLGLDRSLDQDVAYGFRLLVSQRLLGEPPLDLTTAVEALDRHHDLPAPDG